MSSEEDERIILFIEINEHCYGCYPIVDENKRVNCQIIKAKESTLTRNTDLLLDSQQSLIFETRLETTTRREGASQPI